MITWVFATLTVALAISCVVLVFRLRSQTNAPMDDRFSSPARPQRDPAAPLERMDLGVVVLNESLSPVAANSAARRLLKLGERELPARLDSEELSSIARRALASGEPAETEITLWPERRRIRARAVDGDADEVTLFLADVTEEVQAHQVRRQFVLNASHELKTPVAGIQALAETVNQAIEDDPEAAKKFARKLLIESERMARLIQDLLDLSRLEDPANFSKDLVDVGAIAEREAEGLKRLAEEQGVQIDVAVSRDAVIRGDEQQVGLLVRNLVDNAIRYTDKNGHVSIRVARDDTEAVLEVEDDGAGIPLNAQARVFERFFRVDQDRARGSGGTGLGLSIVKHVAELHGGYVSLRSELGEGSTFRVRLPLFSGNGA